MSAKNIDIHKALKLALAGNTYVDIAKVLGCTKQYIHKALQPLMDLMDDSSSVQLYRENKALLFDSLELKLLTAMSNRALKGKDSISSLGIGFSIIFDKRRLELNKATQIVDFVDVSENIVARRARIAELEAERAEIVLRKGSDGVHSV